MVRRLSGYLALIAAGALAGCRPAHPSSVSGALEATDSARVARLEREFPRWLMRLRLPGLAVAVLRDQSVIWTRGYGWADVERRVAVTPETPFNIASLTKPMTAALLLQLVEQGRVSLNDPMARYSNRFQGDSVRIRHVLSMTAESHPPGSAYAYNGDLYSTLAAVLEARTDSTFRALVVRGIFDSLGLTRSVPGIDVVDSLARSTRLFGSERLARYQAGIAALAVPYRTFGLSEQVPALPPPSELNAAANVVSTVGDYARFVAALEKGRLVADSTLTRMWSPNLAPNGRRLPYSLGWFVEDYQGIRLVWHHGYWPNAYSALVLVVPDAQLALIAFANADGLSAPFYRNEGVEGNPLACEFLASFVREGLPCRAAAEAAVAHWDAGRRPSSHRTIGVAAALLADFAGTYQTPSGRLIGIVLQGGRLWWRTARGGLFELYPETESQFFMKSDDRVIRFSAARPVTQLELEIGGNTTVLMRIP